MILNVNLTFDLVVTLTLEIRSRNIDNIIAGYETHIYANFYVPSPSSL